MFEFGDGLSYTTFEAVLELVEFGMDLGQRGALSAVALARDLGRAGFTRGGAETVAVARVTVTNTGSKTSGAEAALVFVAPPVGVAGGKGAPIKSLAGYEKVRGSAD